ncbi:polysaccharide lyase family protein [Actomonas aquatica]|uniref:rhamnogalacturonan endolyase n=1 Tax=Actomonas aquatica TaxID=2866162 RepID=A0ABZ1C980_9BACT|nr:polysaccharide lyase family protein [Opitutus sp. WL0086]WRQ87803.1 polysaccharide lyase family protein [Opitutus sp. WL0086]
MKPRHNPLIALLGVLALGWTALARAAAPVTVSETDALYILDNGIVQASVAKDSGDLVSLRYRDREMLATFLKPDGTPDLERDPPGHNVNGLNRGFTDHQYGFWSHDAMGPRGSGEAIARITIDPVTNGGARAEVSVKGIAQDRLMGTGPGVRGGAETKGQFAADIEIRYALGRGEAGVYTYCQFEHPADYPTTALGEARFCAKLADFFDWMSVADGPHHHKAYPKGLREGDKYVYTVPQAENPAFGWSSTTENVGFWCLNASMEYMSGGPTKVEFAGHRDTNAVSAPCVLNYWRSSHYGGSAVDVAEGEPWAKVIGPFMLYVNAGTTPQAMFDDAKAKQREEAAAWPYAWVEGVDYPLAAERGTVSGRIVLHDPLAPADAPEVSRLRVGLTQTPWTSPIPGRDGEVRVIGWQRDAKHYQFWTEAEADGRFEIGAVRPGTYTLRAFADGVLGELAVADVTVAAGDTTLGDITWTPVRHGRQLWDIGVPNRNGAELFKGEEFWRPDIPLVYAELFPNDVTYVVGKSDYRQDWYFQQVPHNEDPTVEPRPFWGIRDEGRATPFRVVFDVAEVSAGDAHLRLALCGTATRSLEIRLNDEMLGTIDLPMSDGAIARHGRQGLWYETGLSFDAAKLQPGRNELQIIVPAGPINDGILYDYVRLEVESGEET